MERVLLVTRDEHFAHQLKNWLEEFPAELVLEVTEDFESWCRARDAQALGPPPNGDPPAPDASDGAAANGEPPATADPPKPLPPPTLVILDPSLPFPKRPHWVAAL